MLEIKNLNKRYDDFYLEDINISLKAGEIMGFVGRNGAGKSTTIKAVMGILPFDSGSIYIDGINTKENEIKAKQIIGYVGEYVSMYSRVPAKYNYRFVKKFYENWDDEVFHKLIKKFDINLNKSMKKFSKGMKVKFALALALSHHAKLLILDEPTSGLDPVIRDELLQEIHSVSKKENTAIFFSSHITQDIERIASDVTFIDKGRIILSEKIATIRNSYVKIEFKECIPSTLEKFFLYAKSNYGVVKSYEDFKKHLADTEFINAEYSFNKITIDEMLLLLTGKQEKDE